MLNLDYTNIHEKGGQLYDDLGFSNIPALEYDGNVEDDLRELWQDAAPPDRMSNDEITEASRIIIAYLEYIHENEKRTGRLFARIKPSIKKKLKEMAKDQGKSIADLIEEYVLS